MERSLDPICEANESNSGVGRREFIARAGLGLVALGAAGCSARASAATVESVPVSFYQVTPLASQREIVTNGIANHTVGVFPNQDCPLAIREIVSRYLVQLNPEPNAIPTALNGWLFGIAMSSIPFDPSGPFWSSTPGNVWEFEVMSAVARPWLGLDGSNAHVQPNGAYHYHGLPNGLISTLLRQNVGRAPMQLGWAADGFPIYGPWGYSDAMDAGSPVRLMRPGYQLKSGARPADGPKGQYDGSFVEDHAFLAGSGDLDQCNGRYGVLPDFPNGTYHYYLTATFPFVPRFFRGTPDRTFYHDLPGPDALPPALAQLGH